MLSIHLARKFRVAVKLLTAPNAHAGVGRHHALAKSIHGVERHGKAL
jgi:hypothetical protein